MGKTILHLHVKLSDDGTSVQVTNEIDVTSQQESVAAVKALSRALSEICKDRETE